MGFCISRSLGAAKLIDLWAEGKFKLLISEQQASELYEVLFRSRFTIKYRLDDKKIEDLLISFAENAVPVSLEGNSLNLCRDPDDNIIIETAVKGKAKYLVTGDKDITDDDHVLDFLSKHGVAAISLSEFLSVIKKI